jgi:hypothetical protein
MTTCSTIGGARLKAFSGGDLRKSPRRTGGGGDGRGEESVRLLLYGSSVVTIERPFTEPWADLKSLKYRISEDREESLPATRLVVVVEL